MKLHIQQTSTSIASEKLNYCLQNWVAMVFPSLKNKDLAIIGFQKYSH